jgi:predicted flap endonuclease-1-like 5' DNA nuclease
MAIASAQTAVRLLSKDYHAASAGTVGAASEYGGATVSPVNGASVFLEWKVTLPKAGKWYLHVKLAAADARPAHITVNGSKQREPILNQTTGGLMPAHARFFVYGPFSFQRGENLFRLDFSDHMPCLQEFLFTESQQGTAAVTVSAQDLAVAGSKPTQIDGKYSNLLYSGGPPKTFIYWNAVLPNAGQWYLHALMAAGEKRAGALTVNGVLQSGEVFGEVTGGWSSENLAWFRYGPYECAQGRNQLRLDFTNHFPHLHELALTFATPPVVALCEPLTVDPAVTAANEKLLAALEGYVVNAGARCEQTGVPRQSLPEAAVVQHLTNARLSPARGAADKLPLRERTSSKADDLKIILGIGPKIDELLLADGIQTFAQLAVATADRIKGILNRAGSRDASVNPSSWPKQAKLAAAGRFAELLVFQAALKARK